MKNREALKEKLDLTIFIGMNIPIQVSNLMQAKENIIIKGMLPGERKAYRLGVDNCISLLRQLLQTENDNEFVIQVESLGDRQEEFVL